MNLILQSNPSITAEVAWTPICLVLPRDRISTAMPEIRLDLHGHRHLTMAAVCPSPLSLSICAWAATEPWAPINPMMPGCGWYGDQTGHRESCDSQVKGGIDFLIRSSTQIELQLNFKLSPSVVYPGDLKQARRREERNSSFFFCLSVFLPVSPPSHHFFLSTWPHSSDVFSDKRDSEMCFIACSACKAALLSL